MSCQSSILAVLDTSPDTNEVVFSMWMEPLRLIAPDLFHGPSRSQDISILYKGCMLFLFVAEQCSTVCKSHAFFAHSSADRCIGGFQDAAIVNCATVNMGVHGSL